MNRVTRLVWLVFVLTLAASSCTCRGGERTAGDAGTHPGELRRGGVVTIANLNLVDNFDPILAVGNPDIWTGLHVFDQLVRPTKDGRSVEPALAETWDVSPDGLVYTFHLRDGLRFSDGSPLLASDVKFSLDRIAKDRAYWAALYPPFGVATPDHRTVVIQIEAPCAPLLANLSFFAASIVPEAYFKRVGREKFAREPIGSGPFVLADWHRGTRAVVRRNPFYWEAPYPYADEVHFVSINDDMTRMLKLQAGEVDIAEEVPYHQVETLRRVPGMTVQVVRTLRTDMLYLNTRSNALMDRKVRQAIHWAIDREALIRAVLFGHGSVPSSFMPQMAYTNNTDPPYGHDLAKAKQLLAESAYPNGVSVRMPVTGPSSRQQVALLVKSQLEPLGIRVELQGGDGATLGNRLARGDFEMWVDDWTNDVPDPDEFIEAHLVSTSVLAKRSGYENPNVDALAAKAKKEMDPGRRGELYLEIQRIVRDDAVYVGLYWAHDRAAVQGGVHGFALLPTGNYRLWEVWKSP